MKPVQAIHQFHVSCAPGDGVTKSLFYTRRLLRALGYQSEIYCEHIPGELQAEVLPLSSLPRSDDFLLLQHHSLGYRDAAWLDAHPAPCVLVYHNITPPHLLPPGDLPELSRLGREQLLAWAARCIGAIGVSDYNSAELREAGYRSVTTLPLLVDLDELRREPADRTTSEQLREVLNVLFVGRISENKRQHELIEVFDEFRRYASQPARLILAGGITSGVYLQRLRDEIAARGLQHQVYLPGKVTGAVLQAYYRVADLFVCLSEHEGFCMPVLEAMVHDVPVVAREAGGLADTLGEGGLLLDAAQNDPREIAALWHTVIAEPGLRRKVLAGQRRNLARYDASELLGRLAAYLVGLGCAAPRAPEALDQAAPTPYWQIEGPIDSTYSLAIVNREMSLALSLRGHNVGLYRSTPEGGSGDPHWLDRHAPDAAALAAHAQACRHAGIHPAVNLRFDFPPWVDGMLGAVRGVHSYGWEESHFPGQYVAAFNRGLDVVTTLSSQVSKILRDSGVRVPIATVGTGVDHILRETPEPVRMPPEAAAGFRFLHVSSCFPRKGIDVLLAAYGKAFRSSDDVVLVIKTFPNPHNDVEAQLAAARKADSEYPRVVLLNHDLPQNQMLWLYRYCHALVAPSRGEGFGMPMAEAMLFDLPVIVTAWGGQTDFCTPETAWLCDYDFAFTQSHLGAAHSVWAEPRMEHLAQLMREVHAATPQERRRRTDAARALCLAEHTWQRVVERTEGALARLAAQDAWRKEPRVGWLSTWNTRCGVATYSQFLSVAFPSDRLAVLATRGQEVIAPDQDYVMRCWDESIDTQDLADAMEQVRARQLGALVIQYNFGFFSVGALGRLVREAREHGVPAYVFLHATADVEKEGWRTSLRDVAQDLALAERLVVHGVADLNRLKDFGLVDNVMLFPHGVLPTPPAREASDADTPTLARLRGKRVIATYGFLLPHKGVQPLIRAFERLARKDAKLHLLLSTALYPSGVSVQEKRECVALIEELDLADRVTFVTDFLPDQESLALMQAAELIVYPYQFTQESASGAVRIGLASGRPVAVTPLSIFEDVAHAVHRLPGTDAEALAEGLGQLLDDPAALEALRERSAAWCEPRQWNKLSIRLLDLIDGVANDL